jgi:subtilisin family serine protease
VAAAGNDGDRGFHAEFTVGMGEIEELEFEFPRYRKGEDDLPFMAVEGWFSRANRYRFVVSTEGREVGVFQFGDENRIFVDRRGVVRGWYTEDQGHGTILIDIEDNPAVPRAALGAWSLRVEPVAVGGDPELDFWVVNWFTNLRGELPRFLNHVDREETVLSPATAPRILAVGAVSTRSCWPTASGERCYASPPVFGDVASFSAIGPTSDGRAKPEILAPGFGVISARSAGISTSYWSEEELAILSTPDERYWVSQGTSMAAPHVSGTVALLLERYPEMTQEQMRTRLLARSAVIEDARTGELARVLRTGEAVAPVVEMALSELVHEGGGVRLRWFVSKARGAVRYRVYKGFEPPGLFSLLSERNLVGTNPFEIFDANLEPGRTHIYRITAVDEAELEDDLDTLQTVVGGTPTLVFRAPDPNPTQGPVNLRFFLPPTGGGGFYHVAVFDVAGRRVREIETGGFGLESEEKALEWDLQDDSGRRVVSGVYLIRLALDVAPPLPGRTATPVADQAITRRVVVLP